MKYGKTVFVTSAVNKKDMDLDIPHIAIVGRSNVGKSSIINAMCMQKRLAKTSNTPGRTRLINYFLIDESVYLIDLPGYGYAKGSKTEQADWDNMMHSFFDANDKLKLVIMLIDIRRDITIDDSNMMRFLWDNDIPYIVVFTKADKLSNNEKFVRVRSLCEQLKMSKEYTIITSSSKNIGIQQLRDVIEQRIKNTQ